MTTDEISALTIGEVEAIVERASKALASFREIQAALGVPLFAAAPPGSTVNVGLSKAIGHAVNFGLPQNANLLTPEERARKAALMVQFDKDGAPVQDSEEAA